MKNTIGVNGEFGRGKLWAEPQEDGSGNGGGQLRDVRLSITRGAVSGRVLDENEKGVVPVRRLTTAKIGSEYFSRPKL